MPDNPRSFALSPFPRGFVDALPFTLVFVPFGALFGVAAQSAGFDLVEIMGFSVLVVAGASQFTAVQLMQAHAPALLVFVTALAVNLRMGMYSAALAPHLGPARVWQKALVAYSLMDQSYALAARNHEIAPDAPIGDKLAYYAGVCALLLPLWIGSTALGALFGQALPTGLALDFAVPVTFLAMIAPALRSVPHLIASVVSVVAALALGWMPAGTGVLAAGALAMAAGGTAETALARRRAARGDNGAAP